MIHTVQCSAYDRYVVRLHQISLPGLCKENKVSWNQASMCAGESHSGQTGDKQQPVQIDKG